MQNVWLARCALVLAIGCGKVNVSVDAAASDGNEAMDASSDAPPIDAPPQFSSCTGLAATCGPNSNEGCCASAMVPGGTFYRSYDFATDSTYKDMGFPATVSSFVLDKYEVTIGRFRQFVNAGYGTQANPPAAGAGAHPNLPGSGWDPAWNDKLTANTTTLVGLLKCDPNGWTDLPGNNENKPVTCITWYEAMAFCIWDGGYLPTEAEWNYAASGGSEQRAYPWSPSASPGSTTIDCSYSNYYNNPPNASCVSTGGTTRVGFESPKGDGRWGHSDLGGNAWELVLDYYAPTYPVPCTDCANLTAATNRSARGGGFDGDASTVRVGYRYPVFAANSRGAAFGVRCARQP